MERTFILVELEGNAIPDSFDGDERDTANSADKLDDI